MASKLCDSCKSATAALFCRADAAFLCPSCDAKVHAANKLASRHARVVVCEVCEQSPAHVTCKADAASLCLSCDRDIHSANPVAQKHDRVPVVPFYDSLPPNNHHHQHPVVAPPFAKPAGDFVLKLEDDVSREEEEEAASWLLPNPSKAAETPDVNSAHPFLFGDDDVDPYLDVDYGSVDPKFETSGDQNSSGTADGVVPVRSDGVVHGPFVGEGGFDLELTGGSKRFGFGYGAHCLSQCISSSSLDVGVVPDGSTVTDMSNPAGASRALQLSSVDREARVLRYREKRKNRKFEKTIRYASRKAYAETRPRIKGRFAKRADIEAEADRMFGFGVVPSF
ncbi:uncharacterized protein J3R85_006144 [Psidium guajava]|nr:uncharacterized protein J3R85_006144 [Psidium guajava]